MQAHVLHLLFLTAIQVILPATDPHCPQHAAVPSVFSTGSRVHDRGCARGVKASWPWGNPPSRDSTDTTIDSATGPSSQLPTLILGDSHKHSPCSIWVQVSNHAHLVLQAPGAGSVLGLTEMLTYSWPVATPPCHAQGNHS